MSRPGQSYEPPLFAWNVGSIIQEMADRAGVPFDRIDTSLLEGSCEGFSVTNRESVASRIETLGGIFMFDGASFDGLIQFIMRGGEVVAELTDDDMIDDGREIFKRKRDDQITIPKISNLEYFDTEGGLTPDKQTSDRSLAARSVTESTTQTTVIMRADDAARAVVIGHKVSIEDARGEAQFSLPLRWIQLTPTDPVRVNGERMRIVEQGVDETSQAQTLRFDRSSAYQSTIQGVPPPPPVAPPPDLAAAESTIDVMDIPIIQSSDDALGYYVAVSSEGLEWNGAFIEFSRDGGATWPESDSTEVNATVGKLTSTLPLKPFDYPDTTSVVTVELLRADMELEPATLTDMLNRVNLAVIGGTEIVNFGNAVQTGPKTWQLSNFLRGRRGSPVSAHPSGASFVLMALAEYRFVQIEAFDIGRPLSWQVTSFTREGPDDTESLTYIGRSQRERQPAYLDAKHVGGNLVVTWQGVGRTGGGMRVGMGQFFRGYFVELGGVTWTTLEQTITIPYSSGTLSVRQINAITGHGPAATLEV